MPFVVVKVGAYHRVKNTATGKVGKDKFVSKENADIQRANRQRFINLINKSTTSKKKKKK